MHHNESPNKRKEAASKSNIKDNCLGMNFKCNFFKYEN